MAIDVKAKIEEIVTKIQSDEKLQKQFKEDPIKAVESIIGIDLPDDMINTVVEGVKAKITTDKVADVFNVLKGFAGK